MRLQRANDESREPKRDHDEGRDAGPIHERSPSLAIDRRCARFGDTPMQRGDEIRIRRVQTLLFDHAFPGARHDPQPRPLVRPDFRDEAVRLHARRPVRHVDPANAAVRHVTRFVAPVPVDAARGERKFPARPEHRRPIRVIENLGRDVQARARIDALLIIDNLFLVASAEASKVCRAFLMSVSLFAVIAFFSVVISVLS